MKLQKHWIAILIVGIAGLITGWLTAPEKGKETRSNMRNWFLNWFK